MSIATAHSVTGKAQQTVRNLERLGLVEVDNQGSKWSYSWRVWLTPNGQLMCRRVDRVRASARYRCRHHRKR